MKDAEKEVSKIFNEFINSLKPMISALIVVEAINMRDFIDDDETKNTLDEIIDDNLKILQKEIYKEKEK